MMHDVFRILEIFYAPQRRLGPFLYSCVLCPTTVVTGLKLLLLVTGLQLLLLVYDPPHARPVLCSYSQRPSASATSLLIMCHRP